MTSKSTPGPWQVKNEYVPDCLTIIANVDGEIIDGTTHYTYDFIATCEDDGEFSVDAVGNARLIAEAPALLALAIQYRDDLRYPPSPDSIERRLAAIDAVITKVTGAK
jgi:hypothetical protein